MPNLSGEDLDGGVTGLNETTVGHPHGLTVGMDEPTHIAEPVHRCGGVVPPERDDHEASVLDDLGDLSQDGLAVLVLLINVDFHWVVPLITSIE